jgi:hypothetical protein
MTEDETLMERLSRETVPRLQADLTETMGDQAPTVTNIGTELDFAEGGRIYRITLTATLRRADDTGRAVTGNTATGEDWDTTAEAAYQALLNACLDA